MHPSNTLGVLVHRDLELRVGRLGFWSQDSASCTVQGQVLWICDFLAALETTPQPQGSLSPQGAWVILQHRGRCIDVCLKCLFWAMGVLREVIGLALLGASGGTQHQQEGGLCGQGTEDREAAGGCWRLEG